MAYYSEARPILNKNGIDYLFMDGCKFCPEGPLDSFSHADKDPWFVEVQKDDIFVDLGACIGSVAIPMAKRCKRVHAIEPLWADILLKNIQLNDINNITVWSFGLGNGMTSTEIAYGKRRKVVPVASWQSLQAAIGHIDFVKVDVEGYEWSSLQAEDLVGIRDIRIEFHIRRQQDKSDRRLLKLWESYLQESYKVEMETRPEHMTNLIFSDVIYMKATKK